MYKVFPVFLLFLISCSISSDKDKQNQTKNLSDEIELIEGITISKVKFDTSSQGKASKGIYVSFSAEMSAKALETIVEKGFSGYFLNISVLNNEKCIYNSHSLQTSFYGKDVPYTKGAYLATQGVHDIYYTLPFHSLNLPQGSNSLAIIIELLPLKFSNDTSMHEYRQLQFIDYDVVGSETFNVDVMAPKLDKTLLTVNSFEILSKNASGGKLRYDFTVIGNGLPDPFWQLSCGDEIIYTSPVIKNSYTYDIPETTREFYFAPTDVFTIKVFDFDLVPLNGKDILGTWSGTISELKDQKNELTLGKIKSFRYQFTPYEATIKKTKKSRKSR